MSTKILRLLRGWPCVHAVLPMLQLPQWRRTTITATDPSAFAPTIAVATDGSEVPPTDTVTPTDESAHSNSTGLFGTASHTRGCRCAKSLCQKKYCECRLAGIPCTEACKCSNCTNTIKAIEEELPLTKTEESTSILLTSARLTTPDRNPRRKGHKRRHDRRSPVSSPPLSSTPSRQRATSSSRPDSSSRSSSRSPPLPPAAEPPSSLSALVGSSKKTRADTQIAASTSSSMHVQT
eukprot:Filipodium_phascolosomae@DN5870_c0_g1_i1.p1